MVLNFIIRNALCFISAGKVLKVNWFTPYSPTVTKANVMYRHMFHSMFLPDPYLGHLGPHFGQARTVTTWVFDWAASSVFSAVSDSRHSVNIYDFIGNARVVIMWFYVISTLQSWTPWSPQPDYHPDRPQGPWWTENRQNWNFNNVNVNL